ncbi:MAG: hypothetical protein RL410_918, partial [Actinomycetota bacterium]
MSHDLEHHNPHRPAPAPVEHELRAADTDPRIAKRVERQVAIMFALSALATIGFIVSYVAIDKSVYIGLPVVGTISALNLALGGCLAVAVLMIGTGAIHWARKLMPDVEVVEERHEFASSDEDKAALKETFTAGVADSGFLKHRIVRRTLLGAMALLPIPAIVMLRDLGPSPADKKFHTVWRAGVRLVSDVSGLPIKAADIPVGNLVNAIPEG